MATHRNQVWADEVQERALEVQRLAKYLATPRLTEQERLALALRFGQAGLELNLLSQDVRRGNRPCSGQTKAAPPDQERTAFKLTG